MILTRIIVSNWRSLLDEVKVGPFSDGLNVIHAPNGTGKSSLFEAMRRGLFDAHHVTGSEIAAVQPWGRDLTPSVVVEFIEGDDTWRVEKTFLSGKSAKLLRLEGSTFKPVADSRNADERIREILSSEIPGRGLSKQEHWGLAQILWAPQGELHLDKISGNAAESLKAALGIQLSGESGGLIEDRIEERFLEFHTKKGGFKTGKNAAPIVSLNERKDELSQKQVALREKHLNFEQTSHNVEDARQRRLQARREAEAIRETVVKTRSSAEAYTKLKSEQSNKRETESLAKEKYESLNSRQTQIQETRERIDGFKVIAQSKEAKLADLKKEEALAIKHLATQRTFQETARSQRGKIAEKQKRIDLARDYLKYKDRLIELDKRTSQIDVLSNKQTEAKKRHGSILAPTSKQIRDLRKYIGGRNQAKIALKASQIHLTITPENGIEVKNATDNSITSIEAGKTLEFSGDDWVDVSVAGFGAVRASGPEGNSDHYREELVAALEKIESLSQPYGTEDPDKLQDLRDQADKLERDIQGFEERIGTILGGETLDVLMQEKAEVQARIAEIEKIHTDWKPHAPVLSELQSEFEDFSQEIIDTINRAEEAFEKAQSSHTAAERSLNELTAELKVTHGQLEAADQRLTELLNDGLSDEVRIKAISEALMTWQAAKTAAEGAEETLRQYPDDPTKELSKIERQQKALEDAESNARDEEKTAEGQLQTLASEGTYSKLVGAEEELASLGAQIRQESIRMDAIKLLHETISESKSKLLASVSAPVERSATRMLTRIVGPRLGSLKMDGDFVPSSIIPELSSDPVALSNLSGGEQEQLFLITRLALADVLAKDERQLVVLDDVLNATDSGRLARILSLLEEVAERLQIIILTCHPERYRGLEQANFIELN